MLSLTCVPFRRGMITLLLLPGMDGTGNLFEPFADVLGSEFTVKILRYPTSEPLGYVELEAIALAAVPVEGPFVILGESFSGPIAISLAASCSSQLKAIILCCSFVRNPRPLFAVLRPLLKLLPIGAAPVGLLSYLSSRLLHTPALRSALAQAARTWPLPQFAQGFRRCFRSIHQASSKRSAFQCSTYAVRAIESFRELRLSLSCG